MSQSILSESLLLKHAFWLLKERKQNQVVTHQHYTQSLSLLAVITNVYNFVSNSKRNFKFMNYCMVYSTTHRKVVLLLLLLLLWLKNKISVILIQIQIINKLYEYNTKKKSLNLFMLTFLVKKSLYYRSFSFGAYLLICR